jgi:DNA-binding beta-propeller fold protein YncE
VTLARVGFVSLPPGEKPGFDHADVYRARRCMYVAHTGANRVDVLDCEQQTFLSSLPDLPGVAGVLVDEEHDLLFTSDRAAGRVSVFRCSDEVLLGRVDVGPHPNGLAYDRRRRRLYAFNLGDPPGENCTAAVVDLETMRVSFDTRRFEHVETVETEPGAHTTGWDPVGRCLWVLCPGSGGATVYEERA